MSVQPTAAPDLQLDCSILPTTVQLLLQHSWLGANAFGKPFNRRRYCKQDCVLDADADSHTVLLQGCKLGAILRSSSTVVPFLSQSLP